MGHALPRPFGAQPGKGSQESLNPLEICSDQKPSLATLGEKWVPQPQTLWPSCSRPTPMRSCLSSALNPYGSYLAEIKWGFLTLHSVASTDPWNSTSPMLTPIPPPRGPGLPAAPHTCQAHSHPRAFALADPSPRCSSQISTCPASSLSTGFCPNVFF